jgi:hypothetical protein
MAAFDPTSPCLVIAPHLKLPPNNGANILIERKWSQFSNHVPHVDIIGEKTVSRYERGQLVDRKEFSNRHRSKNLASVRTVLYQSHFLLERFLTKRFMIESSKYLNTGNYKTIVFSLIHAASLIDHPECREKPDRKSLFVVETQNDEILWFRNIFTATRNPAAKIVSWLSLRWVKSFLKSHKSDLFLVHMTEEDQKGYLEYFPDHASCVVHAGVDIEERIDLSNFRDGSKVSLLFVGALNVKMNYDALVYFRGRYFPALESEFHDRLKVVVVGSRPSKRVVNLCNRMNWRLHKNVSDQELRDLYQGATFSVLSFPYTTGAKLKLLSSLAHATPFLATANMRPLVDSEIFPCLFSDDPVEWVGRVRKIESQGVKESERLDLVNYARRYSWDAVAGKMFDELRKLNH